ncbi:MAG: MoxR family ATPase [Nostoc sp.]|uniref:AAA family ATPase n=1 Tax=Nostoc sp. TaxID=1180 RepID=UPI002FF3251B
MSETWKIFQKDKKPHKGIEELPAPPPWRCFNKDAFVNKKSLEEIKGETFQVWDKEVELVNAALYLRRPLLVTGRPGTGKSSLAYAIAYQLQLGNVLKWPINTRTTLSEGLYRYDAISRLQDAQLANHIDIGKYVQLGSLGTAFLPNTKPRVLLIDEVDKSDIDLPNDLLNLFEEGEFEIPELARIADQHKRIMVNTSDNQKAEILQGRVTCQEFPLVIMTSNGERDFPPAFLRRCLQLEMPQPTPEQINQIVQSHFSSEPDILKRAEDLIQEFIQRQKGGENLATDQLLNVVFMLTGQNTPSKKDKEILLQYLLQPLDRVRGEF